MSLFNRLPEDPTAAENEALRMLELELSTKQHRRARAVTVSEPPIAFGLSPEFAQLSMEFESAGGVWHLDDDLFMRVEL